MTSIINVNEISTQSGSTITIPTGKTLAITDAGALTIAGAAYNVGTNTVINATADYAITNTDVAGKTACIIGAHAGGGNRTITLPDIAAAPGTATCPITVGATQDAGSGVILKVVDFNGAEQWRGTQKSDYVTLQVLNNAWQILSFKSTGTNYVLNDYTIIETDVVGKEMLTIGCNAQAADRIITLPDLQTSGLKGCSIKVIVTTDAGAAFSVKLNDSSAAEIWTGFQTGDFCTVQKINNKWQVMEHNETCYERRYLSSNHSIGGYEHKKIDGAWTSIHSIGAIWDTSQTEVVVPWDAWADIRLLLNPTSADECSVSVSLKISGTTIYQCEANSTDGRTTNGRMGAWELPVNKDDDIEMWYRNQDDNGRSIYGGSPHHTQFSVSLRRRY